MRTSKPWFSAAILAIAVVFFAAPTPSHADSYQIFLLFTASNSPTAIHDPVGITASGTVVAFVDPTDCGGTPGPCYETFDHGVVVSQSLTLPALAYDNGNSGCAPDASFSASFSDSVCNNGREVYGTNFNSAVHPSEIFTGPDPVADFFASGVLASADLNSSGDFVYLVNALGSSNGEIFEAIDLTTDQVPEPGSIFLLGTGLLAGLGAMRRRSLQQR
jgi:hypothetical protein